MKKSKVAAFALLATSLVLTSCSGDDGKSKKYTYRTWTTALSDKWNPHTWETNADSGMLGYLSEGFVGIQPLNTQTGEWQWTYDLAESVTDVTNDHKQDLVTYGVMDEVPTEETNEYIYEIKLRHGAKFEEKTVNGKTYGGYEIKADHYVESMKLALEPARKNYRANSYYSDETQIAGADLYFYQGSTVNMDNGLAASDPTNVQYGVDDLEVVDGKYYTKDTNKPVFIAYGKPLNYLGGDKLSEYAGYLDATTWAAFIALDPDEDGIVDLTPATLEAFGAVLNASTDWGEDDSCAPAYFYYEKTYGDYNWDGVGIYKVDDYTFRYVLAKPYDINNFKTSLTSNWLVEKNLYNDLSSTDSTGLKTTTYGTSVDTTVSYGPYKLTNFEAGKQVKFTQNEFWRGYTKKDDGTLYAESWFNVNGEKQQLYQTTDVIIDVMDQGTAKQAFEKGELNDYSPTADELVSNYSRSSQLYKEPETYTMRLFFHTDVEDLQLMDSSKGNTNSVVMSNAKFRKAFSLAIDRADWVTNTEGYLPAYSLINSLYYYDVFNDPSSIFRNTDAAKQSIVDLYGIEYGPDKPYKTLDEAYNSVTGYNLTEARSLMAEAYQELLDAGLIQAGANIKIKLAWKKGAIEAPDQAQVTALNKYLTAAVQGSGFGTVELEAVGNLANRYVSVQNGDYAIGYGAWGGAAFYPFTMFRVYMDPSYTSIHESGCWDPTTDTFTLNVPGVDDPVTKTAQRWSVSMAAGGDYGNASNEVKVSILAQLEKAFIERYYCIPLASSTICTLLGYQQDYFAQDYNTMYGFGGLALFRYKYNDAQWEAYVKAQGGTLDYTK